MGVAEVVTILVVGAVEARHYHMLPTHRVVTIEICYNVMYEQSLKDLQYQLWHVGGAILREGTTPTIIRFTAFFSCSVLHKFYHRFEYPRQSSCYDNLVCHKTDHTTV